jgi:hypothetical protein
VGGITGRDPDRVDAQPLQIIQLGGNAIQVADAVVIAVHETTRIDLVKHSVLPPLMTFRVNGLRLGADHKTETSGE